MPSGRPVAPCACCGGERPAKLRASITLGGRQRKVPVCRLCVVGATPEARAAGIDGSDYRRGQGPRQGGA